MKHLRSGIQELKYSDFNQVLREFFITDDVMIIIYIEHFPKKQVGPFQKYAVGGYQNKQTFSFKIFIASVHCTVFCWIFAKSYFS